MAAASVNSTIGIGGTNYSAYSFPGFPPSSFHYCNGETRGRFRERIRPADIDEHTGNGTAKGISNFANVTE